MVVGQDNYKPFKRQAKQLGITGNVEFLQGRSDIPRFLLGADLLIHPAYNENTGTVLLEALVAGLPVLVTDVCGYAHYIEEADAGLLVSSPFRQEALNDKLAFMLTSTERPKWQENALKFAETADIYSMPQRAADYIEDIAQRHQSLKAPGGRA
jgi:UDP-glucose:(heptosyl)LPS alpha-1,3-glucosyltransferase